MIDEETVRYVSNLAKIELKDDEVENYKNEFGKILEFFDQLDEIDPDVEPTYHVIPLKNVFRKDVPGKSLDRDEALKNARHKEEGYFKGPRVVE
ncbi:Asp-tRNA(Asn)/Glu-tRNA(Gln) amidotransferase subunit GatC [Geoglobus acetivorans]|uniref:Aspartyl/glutamyl-tRNA(Asn/Gln) amidotransferase subunit C n=1 Tax=Geoglobus acetivorans TaxID=565033 RepID=A0ABZ3H183_GEOAI|nr:Asp-tRNA(Asn)/Glu-tRNA(Gln) amidotransferase subunit GatC [Geoglobus acetivorans]